MKDTSLNIILGFTGLILTGTVFMYYLGFNKSFSDSSWLTAFFTATSGVCVTGLTIIDISKDLNFTGQVILLILIQAGGLGVFTISNWVILTFRKKLGIVQFDATSKTLGSLSYLPATKFIKRIILFTFFAETLGTVVLFFCFLPDYDYMNALWLALFHSVSAFCNAGFSLFSGNLSGYSSNIAVNLTVMILIITGGIGFIVSTDFYQFLVSRLRGTRGRLSLQSKVSISTSLWLIILGGVLIVLFENTNSFSSENPELSLMKAFFLSITSRTAGFNTIPTSDLNGMTILLLIFLMIVGASAGSTGGGIKTSTFAVIWAHVKSISGQKENTEIFNRSITRADITRATTVFFSYLAILFVSVILIQFFETYGKTSQISRKIFLDHLFEVVSALSTVGLSTGVTPTLGAGGKVVLMICMFTGRIGLLALLTVLPGQHKYISYKYPEENLMIG